MHVRALALFLLLHVYNCGTIYCLCTCTPIFTRTSLKPPPLLKIVQVASGLFDIYSSTYTYFYSGIHPDPYSLIPFLFFTHTSLFLLYSQTNGQKGTNIMNMVISFYNNGMDGTYHRTMTNNSLPAYTNNMLLITSPLSNNPPT